MICLSRLKDRMLCQETLSPWNVASISLVMVSLFPFAFNASDTSFFWLDSGSATPSAGGVYQSLVYNIEIGPLFPCHHKQHRPLQQQGDGSKHLPTFGLVCLF
jgi:hypothetical protein